MSEQPLSGTPLQKLQQPEDEFDAFERRRREALEVLGRDRLFTTYEFEPIRNLEHRLELAKAGGSLEIPDDPEEAAEKITQMANLLKALRAETKPDDLSVDNFSAKVLVVKPSEPQKLELADLEGKIVSEVAIRLMETEAVTYEESLRMSARAVTMSSGLAATDDELKDTAKSVLVDHLLRMEGQTEETVKHVSPTDPDMQLTEEEEDELRLKDSLTPAEKAEAVLTSRKKLKALQRKKKEQIIKNRMAEMRERRDELEELTHDELISQIVKIEIMARALVQSRTLIADYWLLFCVKDPAKPQLAYIRGQMIPKGWEPYFKTIEEVQDLREAKKDFYEWLVYQKNRLDFLGEEDLRALAAHGTFPDIIQQMLGARWDTDSVSNLWG